MITDDEIIDRIILAEGGIYTDDPDDAGGPTRWGITIPVLERHRRRPVTSFDIRNLTRDEAEDIYESQFIRPFNSLPPGALRVNVIDMGVNAGIDRGIRLLQQTIGAQVDGKIGPETIRLSGHRDWNPQFVGVRLAFYENLIISKPQNRKWRPGWRARALSHVFEQNVRQLRAVQTPEQIRKAEPLFGFMGKAA